MSTNRSTFYGAYVESYCPTNCTAYRQSFDAAVVYPFYPTHKSTNYRSNYPALDATIKSADYGSIQSTVE